MKNGLDKRQWVSIIRGVTANAREIGRILVDTLEALKSAIESAKRTLADDFISPEEAKKIVDALLSASILFERFASLPHPSK